MRASLPDDVEAFFLRVAAPAFLTRHDGTIVAWSAAAGRALGYRPEQVLGVPCYALFDGLDPFGNRYCVPGCPVQQACQRGDAPRPHELSLRRAEGGHARFLCTVTPVAGDELGAPFLLYQLHELVAGPPLRPALASTSSSAAPQRSPLAPSSAEDSRLARLSQREREVLLLLAEGASLAEVAERLRIRATTARNRVQAILRKLGVHSKLEAVVLAFRHGLSDPGRPRAEG